MRFRWQEPLKKKMGRKEVGRQEEFSPFPDSQFPTRKLPAAIQPSARFPDRVTHQPMHREPFCTQHCRLPETQG